MSVYKRIVYIKSKLTKLETLNNQSYVVTNIAAKLGVRETDHCRGQKV